MAIKFFFQYDLIIDGIWDYQYDYYQKLDKNKNYYEITGNLIELYVFGNCQNQDIDCLILEDVLKAFPNFKHDDKNRIKECRFKWSTNLMEDEVFYLFLKYNWIKDYIIMEE